MDTFVWGFQAGLGILSAIVFFQFGMAFGTIILMLEIPQKIWKAIKSFFGFVFAVVKWLFA